MPTRPKPPVKAPTALASGRTTYEDVKAMLTCIHEAGHVVVGHHLGLHILSVSVGRGPGQTKCEPAPVVSLDTPNKRELARRIRAVQTAMTMAVAGGLAETIHMEAVEEAGYPSRAAFRAYLKFGSTRLSDVFQAVLPTERHAFPPGSDFAILVRHAGAIYQAKTFAAVRQGCNPETRYERLFEALSIDPSADMLAEIEAVEAKAERILTRHWAAVEAIARALHRSKSGRLNRKQILAHIERHAR